MSFVNLGLLPAVSSVAGTPGQILVNGQYFPVNGAVVVALDGALSGATGFYAVLTGMSGALVTQIQSAAGVLSLNNATGLLTLTSAPANANYVQISNSGTTIYVSGLSTPTLSGVTFAGGAQLTGDGGSAFFTIPTPGNFNVATTSTASNFSVARFLQPQAPLAITAGDGAFIEVGRSASTNNAGTIQFIYTGAGSAANRLVLGLNGTAGPFAVGPASVMVGTRVDSNNGILQLATHTTSGNGLGLGPDNSIWRTAANAVTYNGTLTLVNNLIAQGGTLVGSSNTILSSSSAGTIFFRPNGAGGGTTTNQATLSTAGDLTIASGIIFGDTGNYAANHTASVAQLLATSGWLTNASTSNVVYLTGAQTITGLKTWNSGIFFGNVGIGTGTPGALLHLNATAAAEALKLNSNIGNGTYASFSNSSTDFGFVGAAGSLINGGATTDMAVRSQANLVFATNGNTERVRVTTAGNVGIGTGTPTYKLTVVGGNGSAISTDQGSNQFGGLDINANSTRKGLVQVDTTASVMNIGGDTSIATAFLAAGSEKMRILTNGNVGIGTTTPSGRVNITASTASTSIATTLANAGLFVNAGGGALGLVLGHDSVANRPYIQSISDPTAFSMSLNPYGGNVGVGTGSPNARLEVYNASAGAGTLNDAGAFVTRDDAGSTPAQLILRGKTDTNQQLLLGYNTTLNYGSVQAYQQGTSTKPLVLNGGGGNVGVGTTTPQALFHVSGNAVVGGQTTNSLLSIGLSNTTVNTNNILKLCGLDRFATLSFDTLNTYLSGSFGDIILTPGTVGGTGVMWVKSNGNVGIGLTNPTSKLVVSGTSLFTDVVTHGSGIIMPNSTLTGGGFNWSDVTLSRSAVGTLNLNGQGADGTLNLGANATTIGTIKTNTSAPNALVVGTVVSGPLNLQANNATVLSLGANLMSTFASGILLGNSNVTGGGIAFADTYLSRISAGKLGLEHATAPYLAWTVGGNEVGNVFINGNEFFVGTATAKPLHLRVNNVDALAFDISRVGTFSSGIILGTSNVTGGGIAFGANGNLFTTSAGTLGFNNPGGDPFLSFLNGGTSRGLIGGSAANMVVQAVASLQLNTNAGSNVLTLGTDQGTTAAGYVSAKSYRVTVSGAAIPLIGASATGTFNIDFTNSPALQTLTITGATLFSGVNYVAGGAATIRVNVSGSNSVPIRFPDAWSNGWVMAVPTGLATGRFALLTLNTFAAVDSGVMAAWAVAP